MRKLELRAWLAVRGPARVLEVFVNAEGAAMTRAGFEYILDKHTRCRCRRMSGIGGSFRVAPPASALFTLPDYVE